MGIIVNYQCDQCNTYFYGNKAVFEYAIRQVDGIRSKEPSKRIPLPWEATLSIKDMSDKIVPITGIDKHKIFCSNDCIVKFNDIRKYLETNAPTLGK